MGAEGRGVDRAQRLARERALYQYTSALDRADFEAVAAVLNQAETDGVLERMILEVNDVYGTEPAGKAVTSHEAARPAPRARRRGGEMSDASHTSGFGSLWGGRRLSPGLVAAAAIAVVLVCAGAWIAVDMRSAYVARRSVNNLTDAMFAMFADAAAQRSLRYAPPLLSDAGEAEAPVSDEADAVYTASEGQETIAAEAPQERLIVRTGAMILRVEDTLAARQAIEDLVARLAAEGAYVVSSEQSGGDGGQDPVVSMAIRVPAARFGEAMDTIAGLAVDVVTRSESAQDVTEEYVDLAGRLQALETARDRLLEIMSEADRTEDLLKAEEQVTRREEEIEATQGRMQYLAQSAALARINIQLQPHVLSQPVGDQRWRPVETARRALEALLDGVQGFVDFALFFGIAILPWLLPIGLALYLLYRLGRWIAARRQGREDVPDATGEG